MTMAPSLRKAVLTAHITSSVGWFGAILAYLSLTIAALFSTDIQTVRVAWLAMEMIGWYAIVPLALVTVTIGVLNALGTTWGLFRHYWVLCKLLLTLLATTILILHMPTVGHFAGMDSEATPGSVPVAGGELLHAGGGLLVLLVAAILSVYKPKGMTPYGWRKRYARLSSPSPTPPRH